MALNRQQKGCESAPSIDFGVTDKFPQLGEFTNTESVNNES